MFLDIFEAGTSLEYLERREAGRLEREIQGPGESSCGRSEMRGVAARERGKTLNDQRHYVKREAQDMQSISIVLKTRLVGVSLGGKATGLGVSCQPLVV